MTSGTLNIVVLLMVFILHFNFYYKMDSLVLSYSVRFTCL